MTRKLNEQRIHTGDNGVELHFLMEPPEMYEAGRMYARITIAPGACVSYHEHQAEMESFYVTKGICRVDDNGETQYLKEGDILITPHDQGHAIYNESTEALELIALIISCKQGVNGSDKA